MSKKSSKALPVVIKQERQDELEDKRTTLLFPEMFKCLVKWKEQNSQYFESVTNIQNVAAFNNKVWKFPLGLRLVCLDWNKAIEEYFQTMNCVRVKKILLCFGGQNSTNVQSFKIFLSKFGNHVESITLSINNPHESPVIPYLKMSKVLKHLPSLKELKIYFDKSSHHLIYKTEPLDEAIIQNPCPTLNKLEYLFTNGRLDNKITNEILRRSRYIVKFVQHLPGFHTLDYTINLSYLSELDLTIRFNEDFQQLKQFGGNWKIRVCRLNFSRLYEENWLDIFILLGKNWLDSMEDLNVIFPVKPESERDDLMEQMLKLTTYGRLELPKLKRIEICPVVPIALDFLLPSARSLERIYVKWFGDEEYFDNPSEMYIDAMDHQIVEYLGSEKELERTNIWGLFPKLFSVTSAIGHAERPAKWK